jgi:N-acetylglucosaminyl-diphospho-decaprenol L-rhamnosyltransferase
MDPLALDIGVIYTHERKLMPRLLETMSASGPGLKMRLLLVDNASPDGADQWRPHFPETQILRNGRRLSYAENLNRVLAASTARHVLLMNTDMYFDPSERCLRRMVDFMDGHPQCGVAGCRLLHRDGSDAHAARRFQTLPLILARRCGLSPLMRSTVAHHFYAEHTCHETWECDWLSGCFLMVRRAAAQEIGCLDESYGKYFEDVDFCLRMAQAGWLVMHNGSTSCYHLEQRNSKKMLSLDAWRHLVAYSRWIRKWGFVPSPTAKPATPRRAAA